MARPIKEWVVYKGEEVIFAGNTRECAERLGVSNSTFLFYTTPTYAERTPSGNAFRAVDVTNVWRDMV